MNVTQTSSLDNRSIQVFLTFVIVAVSPRELEQKLLGQILRLQGQIV